jgi:hypothetical protein
MTGALTELPLALSTRSYMLLFAGDLTAATSLTDEGQAVTEATGSNLRPMPRWPWPRCAAGKPRRPP